MRIRRTLPIVLAVVVVAATLTLAVQLRKHAPPEPARLLPGADAFVYANFGWARKANGGKLLLPVAHEPEYERFIQETGFDFERDLDAGSYRAAVRAEGVRLLPGAARLLAEFAAAGWPQAVGSSAPPREMEPALGRNAPAIISIVVVFPAPLGPSSPKVSPRRTSKERPSTATCGNSWHFAPGLLSPCRIRRNCCRSLRRCRASAARWC